MAGSFPLVGLWPVLLVALKSGMGFVGNPFSEASGPGVYLWLMLYSLPLGALFVGMGILILLLAYCCGRAFVAGEVGVEVARAPTRDPVMLKEHGIRRKGLNLLQIATPVSIFSMFIPRLFFLGCFIGALCCAAGEIITIFAAPIAECVVERRHAGAVPLE